MRVKISEKALAGRERKARRAEEKQAAAAAAAAAEVDAWWQIGAPGKSARDKREEKSAAKARAREERREIERRTDEPEPEPEPKSDPEVTRWYFFDEEAYRQEVIRNKRRKVDRSCYMQLWDLDALRAAQKCSCIEEGLATIKELMYEEEFVLRYLGMPPDIEKSHIPEQLTRFNDAYVAYEKEHLGSMVRREGENTRGMKHRLYAAYVNSEANPLFVHDPDSRERALWEELKKNGTKMSAQAIRYREEGALLRLSVRRKWRSEGVSSK